MGNLIYHMKKIIQLIIGMISLVAVTSAHAIIISETYEGRQLVTEGDAYNFVFDMVYENITSTTDSNLVLTSDATSLENATWNSASISLNLWSWDQEFEKTKWLITAYDMFGDASYVINRDKFKWNGGTDSDYHYLNATYEFTAEDIAQFSEWGWGNVRVKAARTNTDNFNDFYIKQVSMTVDVPEPGTLLLTALGLLGLAGGHSGRKRA
jgi:hypothetical protein